MLNHTVSSHRLAAIILICLWFAAPAGKRVLAQAEAESDETTNVLAVIGGSTLDRRHDGRYFADGIAEIEDQFTLETDAGTSPTIYRMRYRDVPFYYVRFHGFPDIEARESKGSNFVTMFAAFHQLGVTHIIGGATSGGIHPTYRNGDLVIADDIINLNYERPSSVLVAAKIRRDGVRAQYNPPFCPDIHEQLTLFYHNRHHID